MANVIVALTLLAVGDAALINLFVLFQARGGSRPRLQYRRLAVVLTRIPTSAHSRRVRCRVAMVALLWVRAVSAEQVLPERMAAMRRPALSPAAAAALPAR
jgi:hypothetical protein